LDSGRLVKNFVEKISTMDGRFEIVADEAMMAAKSILGLYCLDLSQPLLLKIEHGNTELLNEIKEFIVSHDKYSALNSSKDESL
jgi:phosphotransferase system HPr-like phosphotransfer protein